ncbi:MAG: undecaprenyl-diphosphate phosphatase [Deferrisomatales bacterium]|nr:undecaprenyl-diphosphate phosphatase [Deferrisomatales bacterium]
MGGLESVLLGVLQGLTEFLPVSSSGHLVLAQSLLPRFRPPGVLFEVLLHGGTLLAVMVYFRRDLWEVLRSLRPGGDPARRRLALLLAAATVPTAFIGLAFQGPLEALFHAPRSAAAMLLVTGALLWVSEALARPRVGIEGVGYGRALAVGTVQGLAIVPGISRSGSTIAAGTLLGVRGEDSARFSFLLSVPAILGALVLHLPELGAVEPGRPAAYAAGTAAAFLSGLWALRFLMSAIRRGRFRWFAVYCWLLGAGYLLLGP